jgi:threonine dehydrogenase-like Zn-dependent dehydrogenase
LKAVVYTAPLELTVMEVAEPEPTSDEVVIEVRAVGICGSELEGFSSQSPFRVPPLIMGHEFAGVRTDTGETVVVNPVISCMECDLCSRGYVNVCRHRQILGIQRAGGYAEKVAVPLRNCVTVSNDVPFTTLALTEPVACAVHALRLAQQHDPWPQRVGIIGCGTVGLALALVAAGRGIANVEISELSQARQDVARRAGFSASAGLDGEYDVVFDTVGLAQTRGASLSHVRPGGSAVWVGLHGPDADLDGRAMIRTETRVLTTFCYDRHDFAVAARFTQRLDPKDWIAVHPLETGDTVFLDLLQGPGPAVKSMLVC